MKKNKKLLNICCNKCIVYTINKNKGNKGEMKMKQNKNKTNRIALRVTDELKDYLKQKGNISKYITKLIEEERKNNNGNN